MRARQREIVRPFRGCALKISLRLERFNFPLELAELFSIETQNAERDLANAGRLIWRQRHVAEHLRFSGLTPGRVAANGKHYRTALLPMFGLEFFNELNPAEIGRLLDRKRA